MTPWHVERSSGEVARHDTDHEEHHTPGTLVLTGVFLLSFVVYYFANWKWLSDVWQVR